MSELTSLDNERIENITLAHSIHELEATIATQRALIADLVGALEWIARHPCTNHYGGFEHDVVNDCHDYQKYLAEHPENWPDDYLITVAAGKQMCDGCFARAALKAAKEAE